ncbi:Uma2 family endonuclease [Deinococcus sp.]|uniref:Uma2 family endonuclease n=1 Tax=Deinococcus sp. TaxID=47478 RepID=UPI003C7BFF39
MSDPALRKMTEAEYLETEAVNSYKREFVDGFVYALHGEDTPHAQAGALSKHGLITLNIAAVLRSLARKHRCRVYASDMSVRISGASVLRAGGPLYYYPDVVLTCVPVDDNARFLEQPCLVVEVLSESTKNIDRREKLHDYRTLPSLQGYLMVDTVVRAARLYVRDVEGWREEYIEGEGSLALPCVDVAMTLEDMYEDTEV